MKLLVTGFEPFGGVTENPSAELLKALKAVGVRTVLLPNAIRRAPAVLDRAVRWERPDTVLLLGESRDAKEILVGRGAVNVLDTMNHLGRNIPDNDGNSAFDEAVVPGRAGSIRSTMPVAAIEQAIRAAGIPVRQRSHGGTHVSNQCFYRLLAEGRVPRVGYIHIPPIQHRPGRPGMPFATLLKAVSEAIGVLARERPRRSRKSRQRA